VKKSTPNTCHKEEFYLKESFIKAYFCALYLFFLLLSFALQRHIHNKTMEIIVDVLGGKDLARMDDNNLSDPYCRIGVADSNNNFVDLRSTICSEVCLFCFCYVAHVNQVRHFTINPVWSRASFVWYV
jgi:hypothetical protein